MSSAAPYALIVQHLLGGAALCRVVDDAGQLVGELSRAALAARLPVAPLDGLIAADLMMPAEEIRGDRAASPHVAPDEA